MLQCETVTDIFVLVLRLLTKKSPFLLPLAHAPRPHQPLVFAPLQYCCHVFLAVFGWNYGQVTSSSTLRLGGTACVDTRWISDSSMACKPANG